MCTDGVGWRCDSLQCCKNSCSSKGSCTHITWFNDTRCWLSSSGCTSLADGFANITEGIYRKVPGHLTAEHNRSQQTTMHECAQWDFFHNDVPSAIRVPPRKFAHERWQVFETGAETFQQTGAIMGLSFRVAIHSLQRVQIECDLVETQLREGEQTTHGFAFESTGCGDSLFNANLHFSNEPGGVWADPFVDGAMGCKRIRLLVQHPAGLFSSSTEHMCRTLAPTRHTALRHCPPPCSSPSHNLWNAPAPATCNHRPRVFPEPVANVVQIC